MAGDSDAAAGKVLRALPHLTGASTRSARELLLRHSNDAAAFITHTRTFEADFVGRLKDLGVSAEVMARLEEFMRIGLNPNVTYQCVRAVVQLPLPDAVVTDSSDLLHLHESNVGFVRGLFASKQIDKDVALRNETEGMTVTWYFFASAYSGRIGPSKSFLKKLDAAEIPYYIYLPQ